MILSGFSCQAHLSNLWVYKNILGKYKRGFFYILSSLITVECMSRTFLNKGIYRQLCGFLVLIFFLLLPHHGFGKNSEKKSKLHIDRKKSKEGVDWIRGEVYSSAKVVLPLLEPPESRGWNSFSSIAEAREAARLQAKERAEIRLTSLIYELRLDSYLRISDLLKKDKYFLKRMSSLPSRFIIEERRTGEGYVMVTLRMPFLGVKGLYGLLLHQGYASEEPPEIEHSSPPDSISSLILDLRHLKDFQPSLTPSIYTRQGRKIYAPEIAGRRCTVQTGMVSYRTSLEKAQNDKRAGNHPYYGFAFRLAGPGRSSFSLQDSDAQRILGSISGRNTLKQCKIFLLIQ